jgi:hypothetical protein
MKHLKHFQKLLLKKAYFDEDTCALFFTYPKGGWMKSPNIGGIPLEYVGEHDDGELPLNKIVNYKDIKEWKYCPSGKPIFGYISGF